MRRIKLTILILIMMLFMVSSECIAAMPDISAGKTNFDIFKGMYILTNGVKVVYSERTMTSERAVVQLKDQKVWASGKVKLEQEGLNFVGDKIFVKGLDHIVEALGGLQLNQKDGLKITAEYGTFSWDSKEADFYGKVKVTGAKDVKKNVEYAHVKYNVVDNKIILLEKKIKNMPSMKLSETDPTE